MRLTFRIIGSCSWRKWMASLRCHDERRVNGIGSGLPSHTHSSLRGSQDCDDP